jgi:acyl-CoA thioester hydrolase
MQTKDPLTLLAECSEIVTVSVQWGDQDAFQHVNNTIFLRWFEVGRIAYFENIGLSHSLPGRNLGPILAAVSCSFKRQVRFPDRVQIGTRVIRTGNSSAVLSHVIYSEAQEDIVADGTSTVVYFDYATNQSCRIPDEVRAVIAAKEGRATL